MSSNAKVIKSISTLRKFLREKRLSGAKIGFVPTMGALHDGHLSLMSKAGKENDVVVISIFVNPTQFGPGEDYADYPRTLKTDVKLASSVGVDVVFAPPVSVMYSPDNATFIDVIKLTEGLCGRSRPGHFRGVATVVTKLFNIVQPDNAYFGNKDFQQLAVIKRMVSDLNIPVKVKGCPIVREKDGLAMSSRNKYLSSDDRLRAAGINRCLKDVRRSAIAGQTDVSVLVKELTKNLKKCSDKVDYAEFVDADSFQPLQTISGRVCVAVAVYVGDTRLIDNIVFNCK